jgi:selenocysteine lyase/cysteine desulfurase
VRALFARMVGVSNASRIAIVPAVSYGLAAAARNLPIGRGRNVVVSEEQFPSNVHVWRSACRRGGAELRVIAPPVDGAGRGEAWNTAVLEAIDVATAVVALPHLHWTDGTRFDLQRIGERAREVGAALVVDGTQSVGALPFDVAQIRPDALVCAGYKWLLGPYSLGVAYYGPRFDEGEPLEETWIGRAGSEDFRSLVLYRDDYRPGAARYDVGEPSNFALMPMLETALGLVLEWGWQHLRLLRLAQ